MSLLWMDYETEFDRLVENAFQWESKQKAEYFASLSPRVRKIIYRDTCYNVDFLYTAFVLNDDKIIEDYAIWLFELMDSIFKHMTSKETAEYVVHHLEAIRESIPEADMFGHSCYETEIREYMDLLALSVTIPQHLIDCRSVIRTVRKEFPDLPIAVGGKAFESTDDICCIIM